MDLLRRLALNDLRRLHRKTFKGTKWQHWVPRGLPSAVLREWLTRRLFLLFACRNYHWPKGHPITKRFVRRAKAVLEGRYFDSEQYIDEQIMQQMRDYARFTKKAIKQMDEVQVERFLALAGIMLDKNLPLAKKQRCLWEYYHLPRKHLPKVEDHILMSKAPNGRTLKQYLIRYNELNYDKFMVRFGKYFPNTTRASFSVYRSNLRKEGYDMPHFQRGVNGGNLLEEQPKKAKKAAKKKATKKKATKKKAAKRGRTATHTNRISAATSTPRKASKKKAKKGRRKKS
jgi:hypothetical protein